MITIKGSYNTANVMIDEIDETAREQIQTFLNHPAFANTYIAVMPDVHAGKGAVIGFTMKTNGFISQCHRRRYRLRNVICKIQP